jgi:hypothetical protein
VDEEGFSIERVIVGDNQVEKAAERILLNAAAHLPDAGQRPPFLICPLSGVQNELRRDGLEASIYCSSRLNKSETFDLIAV